MSQNNSHGLGGESSYEPSTSSALSWLSRCIIFAGIAWVAYIFTSELDALRSNFEVKSVPWLMYTFGAGILALLLTVPIFRTLLCFYSGRPVGYIYSAKLLFVAQILRHLPGRVWGVVYLVNETKSNINPVAMVRANIDFMLLSMLFSLLTSVLLVVGVLISPTIAVVLTVSGIAVTAVALRLDWIGKLILLAFKFAPVRTARYARAIKPHQPLSWDSIGVLIVLFVLVWCIYLSIWWALTETFDALVDINIWLLCASYMIAWVGGYLVMITPGGLGVREAGFVALASTLTSIPNLTFLALFIRVWQVLIELVLFLTFVFVKPDYKFKTTAQETCK